MVRQAIRTGAEVGPVPGIAGNECKFWFIRPSVDLPQVITSGVYAQSALVARIVNGPSSLPWTMSGTGTPVLTQWTKARVTQFVCVIKFEPRTVMKDSASLPEDYYVAYRVQNSASASAPGNTVPISSYHADDPRWIMKRISGRFGKKVVIRWSPKDTYPYILNNNIFTIGTTANSCTAPGTIQLIDIVYGNDENHDTVAQPLPPCTYQLFYHLHAFDRNPSFNFG